MGVVRIRSNPVKASTSAFSAFNKPARKRGGTVNFISFIQSQTVRVQVVAASIALRF